MLRHKDLLLCGVGALAFHLMQMFDIEVRAHLGSAYCLGADAVREQRGCWAQHKG